MARNILADLEAAAAGAVALGREAAIPFAGIGNYIYQGATGKDADASDAMDWAREKLGSVSMPLSEQGQRAADEITQAVMTPVRDAYQSGVGGIKAIAESDLAGNMAGRVGNWWDEVSPDIKAGLEMGAGALDAVNPVLGAGAIALTRGARGAPELAEALMDAGPKQRGASMLADELDTVRAQRAAIEDYHNDVDFIQADTIDYTIDERLGTRKKTGQYRGAPRNVTSPQKLGSMRKELTRLLEKGTPGRLWYDESTQAATDLTGGQRRNKHLFAGANAITSRGAAVPSNQLFGIKGSNQLQVGDPGQSGRFPTAQGEAMDTLGSGVPYEGGPKETPFYEGLTIDERAEGIRPTNDLWMARAFDYTTPEGDTWSEGLGQAQHRFMDNEINALVETANKAKIGGVDDWTPERVQAAIWVAKKAEMEGTDVGKASLNFKDNLDNLTANIRYEAYPSTSLDHMSGVSGSEEYADLVNTMLQNEAGQDRLALGTGALTRPSDRAFGEYEGTVSPSTTVPVLAAPETGKAAIDRSSEKLINTIASGRGMNLGQDTVGTTYLRPAKKGEEKNAARLNLGSAPGPAEIKDMNERLKAVGPDVFAVSTKDGVEILNTGDTPTKEFQANLKKVFKGGDAKPEFLHNSGGLVGNQWWMEEGGTQGFKPSRYMRDIDAQDLGPEAMKRAERAIANEADTLNQMDMALEKSGMTTGKRDNVLTLTREIMVKKGFEGIREAVRKGLLPAVALSILGSQVQTSTGPDSPPGLS